MIQVYFLACWFPFFALLIFALVSALSFFPKNTNAAAHVRLQRPAEALRRQRDHHIHDVKQRRGKAKPARNCCVSNAQR